MIIFDNYIIKYLILLFFKDTDITPTLERLKSDKQTYISWMSGNTEVEQLQRFCVAYEYNCAMDHVRSTGAESESIEAELNKFLSLQRDMQSEADSYETRAKEIERQRSSESEGGFQTLKHDEQELSKELVKLTASCSNQKVIYIFF